MLIRSLFSALLFLASTLVLAEKVRIPLGSQSDANINKPVHGSTKADVQAQFGSPESSRGPVGDPPIYFWEYPNFTVYFESDRVIHSVSKVKSKSAYKK